MSKIHTKGHITVYYSYLTNKQKTHRAVDGHEVGIHGNNPELDFKERNIKVCGTNINNTQLSLFICCMIQRL